MTVEQFDKRIDTIVGHLRAASLDARDNGLEEGVVFAGIAADALNTLVRETRDAIARGDR